MIDLKLKENHVRILWGLLFLVLPSAGYSLSPIVQYQDLVAGSGELGFADGPFYEAQFARPLGLSLNSDNSVLYVADSKNNRVRAIALEEKNKVETIAGTGVAGDRNGPISIASFSLPAGVAFIPTGKIAVNDIGNRLIRLIDLKTNMVSTLVGSGQKTESKDGLGIQLAGVWDIVYFSQDECLYFSQPETGLLQKINIKNDHVETVLKNNPKVPHPKALAVIDGKLYLADSKLTQIYEIQTEDSKTAKSGDEAEKKPKEVLLQLVGEAHDVIALTGYQKKLYAYQVDPKAPIFRILPEPGPVLFTSVWGQRLTYPNVSSILPQFKGMTTADRVGFLPDPNWAGRFYITSPHSSYVATFCDLNFMNKDIDFGEDTSNSAGIHDLEYPYTKPPHTFRILLVGRSYLFWQADDRQFESKGFEGENQNLLTTLAKRMELSLNTMAALNDQPVHYEVLNGGMHHGGNELNVFPYYVVPPLVQKYDIDLVLIMKDPSLDISSFRLSPSNGDGIPADKPDMEYNLEPDSEKFKSGELHDLFALLKSKKMVQEQGKQWGFDNSKVIADPETEASLIHLMGKPLKRLQEKLGTIKTSGGKPCQMQFWYFPIFFSAARSERQFWKDLCDDSKIPYLDLSGDFATLGLTYWPYYGPSIGHFTKDGMTFFSTIMIHELITNKLIPYHSSPN